MDGDPVRALHGSRVHPGHHRGGLRHRGLLRRDGPLLRGRHQDALLHRGYRRDG
ncbi:MAG: hypothetical protein ABR540_22160 [Acidimicrobiales bacterium]